MKRQQHIWQYVKSYKFNSIFIKTLLLIFITVVLPLLILCLSIYQYNRLNVQKEIESTNINALSKIINVVDMIALESDKLSIQLAADMDVNLMLSYTDLRLKDYSTYEKFRNFYRTMEFIQMTKDVMDSTYIYYEKSDYIMSTRADSMEFEYFPDKGWKAQYDSMKTGSGNMVLSRVVYDAISKTSKIFLTTFKKFSSYGENGVILVNIDIEKLKKLIDTANSKKEHQVIIATREGSIVYDTDMGTIGKKLNEVYGDSIFSLQNASSTSIHRVEGLDQVVTADRSGYNDWIYFLATPISQYSEKTNGMKQFMLLLVIMSFLMVVGISFFISIKVFQPIRNMLSVIDEPQEWEGIIDMELRRPLNEFRYIAGNIIKSFDRSKQLEEEVRERVTLLRKTQSIALQAQINPHFIYNTIEAITWKARTITGGENEVSEMLTSLSQLLRITLETGESMVTISKEIEHVKLYLDMQNMRYGNKFHVEWDIDESIMECKIIKLTLQPIIENAIYHGIKPKKSKGLIKITGSADESSVFIDILDDGVGIPGEEVYRLNKSMGEDFIKEDMNIGIRNVNQRIKLFFGEEYGITISSRLNNYTLVKIVIPKV